MKKISRFIRNNYKFLIGVIVGLLLSGTGVYAANTIYSKNVTYDNTNSGLESTNVQDALDETYNKCFPKETNKIINLYNDGSSITKVNIGGDDSKPEVNLNATQGIMLDNNGNYRYYGSNPNNYVKFNDELWRIIGAFINIDDGTGKRETRLKIIRNESIGQYSWDSSPSNINLGRGENDYTVSTLRLLLNDIYYYSYEDSCFNRENNGASKCDFTDIGLDDNARSMIDNAVYHLGSYSNGDLFADDFYNYERGTNIYITAWVDKLAVIYPSDYMYASDLSLCLQNGTNAEDDSCKNNNWLFYSGGQWTLMPSNFASYLVFGISTKGHVYAHYAYYPYDIFPTAYLKSSITITGGSGTSSDPYTLE